MKVGIVVPFSWSFWGAVLEHAELKSEALRARGHEVKIVIGNDPPGTFTRALHPFHYFAMLGAAAFGALVMQPFRHIAPVWLILTVSVLCGMVAGVMVIHRVVRNAERFAREDLGTACPRCGYDIRGSAWRCPECGEAFR